MARTSTSTISSDSCLGEEIDREEEVIATLQPNDLAANERQCTEGSTGGIGSVHNGARATREFSSVPPQHSFKNYLNNFSKYASHTAGFAERDNSCFQPHSRYESFPEFKEENMDNSTFLGDWKKKLSVAFMKKEEDDISASLPIDTRSQIIAPTQEAQLFSSENLPSTSNPSATNAPENVDGQLDRERKISDVYVRNGRKIEKGCVEHSDANRKQIADRIDLLRQSKERRIHMQRFWMPDTTTSECYNCSRPFTNFRRRHHCRICGNIFCNKCCSNYLAITIGIDITKSRTERTCNYCRDTAENFCSSIPIAIVEPVSVKTSTGTGSSTPPLASIFQKLPTAAKTTSMSAQSLLRDKVLQDCSVPLKKIWDEMMESRSGLPYVKVRDGLKSYTDCMSGESIYKWFVSNDKIEGAESLDQGLWLGQALIDAKFLIPLKKKRRKFEISPNVYYRTGGVNAFVLRRTRSNDDFLDDEDSPFHLPDNSNAGSDSSDDYSEDESEKTTLTEIDKPECPESNFGMSTYVFPPDSVSDKDVSIEKRRPRSTKPFTDSCDIDAQLFNSPGNIALEQQMSLESLQNNLPYIDIPATVFEDSETPPTSLLPTTPTRVKDDLIFSEKFPPQELSKNSYLMHLVAFLHQSLQYYEVTFEWALLIFKFSKILSETVKPNLRNREELTDIREYIKIKCIPGGSKEESRVINGVAFSGNVSCKGMSDCIPSLSQVLLCRGSVECNNYRNSDGDPTRLVALETINQQKKSYNYLCTKRILAIQPPINLVLMEFNVVKKVEKMLMEENITVVKNVKRSNLQRLSRVLDCEIAERVENLGITETHYRPGCFEKFYVETFQIGNINKSICVFDDCDKEKYATMILRGSDSLDELRKVKHVVLEMVIAFHNSVLERSFLLDSNAQNYFHFTHFPFAASEVVDFASQYLSTFINSSHMQLFKKRQETSRQEPIVKDTSTQSPVSAARKKHAFQSNKPSAVTSVDSNNGAIAQNSLEPHVNSLFSIFRNEFRSTILSTSPHVLITCPFLESNLGFNSPLRRYIFPSAKNESSNDNKKFDPVRHKYWSGRFPGETPLPPIFKYDGCVENLNDVEPEFDVEMLPFNETAIFDKSNIVERKPHRFLSFVTGKSIDGPEFMNLLADFRIHGHSTVYDELVNIEKRHNKRVSDKRAAFEEKMRKRRKHEKSRRCMPDCLDYRYHQEFNILVIVTSSEPTKEPKLEQRFCCYFLYKKTPFYHPTDDWPLGRFLEEICFADKVCAQCCLEPTSHLRRFYNANCCLQVSLHAKELPKPLSSWASEAIIMWNYCPTCRKMSPMSKMSDNTWRYSFSKYLENCLSAFNLEVSHGKDEKTAPNNSPSCKHSLFRDHYQYFVFKNRIAAFRVFNVNVYEVSLPEKFALDGDYSYTVKAFNENYKDLMSRLEDMVALIRSKLNASLELVKNTEVMVRASNSVNRKKIYQLLYNLSDELNKSLESGKNRCAESIENSFQQKHLAEEKNDWNRYHSHLLMKNCVAQFCQSWNSNLSRLAKAEADLKNAIGKETKAAAAGAQGLPPPTVPSTLSVDSKLTVSVCVGSMEHSYKAVESSGTFESASIDSHVNFTPAGNETAPMNDVDQVNKDTDIEFSCAELRRDTSTSTIADLSSTLDEENSDKVADEDEKTCSVILDVKYDRPYVENGIEDTYTKARKRSEVIEESFFIIDNSRSNKNERTRKLGLNKEGEENNKISMYSAGTAVSNMIMKSAPKNVVSPNDTNVRERHANSEDIGQVVTVAYDGRTFSGVLKWVGNLDLGDVKLNHGLIGGIELEEADSIAGNGYYKDKKVFDCEPNRGILVPLIGIFVLSHDDKPANVSNDGPSPSATKKRPVTELSAKSPFQIDDHFLSGSETNNSSKTSMPILISLRTPISIAAFSLSSDFYKSKLTQLEVQQSANESAVFVDRASSFVNEAEDGMLTISQSQNDADAAASPIPKVVYNPNQPPSSPKLKQVFFEHNFSDNSENKCQFKCKIWYPLEFKKLRKRSFIEKEDEDIESSFIKNLAQTVEVKMSAGRSNSRFYRTESHRLIVKSLKTLELLDFIDPFFAASYFKYFNKCLDEGLPTALCKIYGVFRVEYKSVETSKSFDFIVMEDLFYGRECSRKFDLKGVYKLLQSTDKSYQHLVDNKKMISDQHMTTVMQEDPIFTRPHSKHILIEALSRDAKFLAENERIDYSLLIGLDDNKLEMAVGIIDYVRKFGFDKKFEMATKSVMIYFSRNGPQNADAREWMPTIVSPDLYYERFINQMQQVILAIPDRWFGLESTVNEKGNEKWTCGLQSLRGEKVHHINPYPTYPYGGESNKPPNGVANKRYAPKTNNNAVTSNANNNNDKQQLNKSIVD